jgi:hypothetical protein
MAKSSSPSFPKGMKVITGPGDTMIQAAKSVPGAGKSVIVVNNATTQTPLSSANDRSTDK